MKKLESFSTYLNNLDDDDFFKILILELKILFVALFAFVSVLFAYNLEIDTENKSILNGFEKIEEERQKRLLEEEKRSSLYSLVKKEERMKNVISFLQSPQVDEETIESSFDGFDDYVSKAFEESLKEETLKVVNEPIYEVKEVKEQNEIVEQPIQISTTQTTYSANMLSIPSANISANYNVTDSSQHSVDSNDIILDVNYLNLTGHKRFFGHNTKSLSTLKNTVVGDVVTITNANNEPTQYTVVYSKHATMNSERTDIYDNDSLESVLNNDCEQIITCDGKRNGLGRWIVLLK